MLELSSMDTYKGIKGQINALKVDLEKIMLVAFQSGAKKIFAKYPDMLKSFSWRQYTPYFADGNTCSFNARYDEPSIKLIGQRMDDEDADDYCEYEAYEETCISSYSLKGLKEEFKEKGRLAVLTEYGLSEVQAEKYLNMLGEILEFLAVFDDDDYLMMFDDHSTVIVTAAETIIEGYDHD